MSSTASGLAIEDDAAKSLFNAELEEAQQFIDSEKPEEALQHCHRAIFYGKRLGRDVSPIYQCIADLHRSLVKSAADRSERKQQRRKAISAYHMALETSSDVSMKMQLLRSIGEMQRDLELYLEAADVFKQMSALGSDSQDTVTQRDGLELLGDVLLRHACKHSNELLPRSDKIEEALTIFEQALSMCDPDEHDAAARLHVHIANCFYKLRKYEIAIFFYKKVSGVLNFASSQMDYARHVFFSLGNCYSCLKDFEEAHKAYSTSLEMSLVANDNVSITKCFLSLAKLRAALNDDDNNIREIILKSLQYCPKSSLLEYECRMVLGEVEHCLQLFTSAAFQFAKSRRIAKELRDVALNVAATEKLQQVCKSEFVVCENNEFYLFPRDEHTEAIRLSASLRSLCDAVPLYAPSSNTSISGFTINTHSDFDKENDAEFDKEKDKENDFLDLLSNLCERRIDEQRCKLEPKPVPMAVTFAKPLPPSNNKSLRSLISFSRRRGHRPSLASRDLNTTTSTNQTESTSAGCSRATSPSSTGSRRRSLFSFKRNKSNTKMLEF